MNDPSRLEEFNRLLARLVGEVLHTIEYDERDYEGIKLIRSGLAYLKFKKYDNKIPEYLLYLPKLKLHLGFAFRRPEIGVYCTWHILRNAKSLCSYVGLHDTDGFLKNHLALIQNRKVKQVFFIPDKLNLFIEFDNHYWLALFPHNLGFQIHASSNHWYVHNHQLECKYIPVSY